MSALILLLPYLLTTKVRCLQKNNIGHTNAGAIRRVEEDLGRPILWDICILHTNERPFIKYFMYCDYKGKKIKSTCPSHDGFIGKQFKDKKLELKDIVKFKTISGKVLPYDENFIKSFNCDTAYLHAIGLAIQNGWKNFPEKLKTKVIGKSHKGR